MYIYIYVRKVSAQDELLIPPSTSLINDFRPFANVMPFSSFLEYEAGALHYFVGCSQILLVSWVIMKFCVNLSSLGVVKFVYLVADGDTCKIIHSASFITRTRRVGVDQRAVASFILPQYIADSMLALSCHLCNILPSDRALIYLELVGTFFFQPVINVYYNFLLKLVHRMP